MTPTRRASPGCTHDPWPCCQKPASEYGGRPKNTICNECKALINTGRDAIARAQNTGDEVYSWALEPHWWSQYYGPYEFSYGGGDTRLANAMYALVTALATPVHGKIDYRRRVPRVLEGGIEDIWKRHWEGQAPFQMKAATRDHLNELDSAIRAALEDTYAEGKNRGRSALLQLATGELSIMDFDKTVAKPKGSTR